MLIGQVLLRPSSLKEEGLQQWADKQYDYLTLLSKEISKMHEQIMELNDELKEALAMRCTRKCDRRER
jgi:hypothetical protein